LVINRLIVLIFSEIFLVQTNYSSKKSDFKGALFNILFVDKFVGLENVLIFAAPLKGKYYDL
jgi:hypothetical protein